MGVWGVGCSSVVLSIMIVVSHTFKPPLRIIHIEGAYVIFPSSGVFQSNETTSH